MPSPAVRWLSPALLVSPTAGRLFPTRNGLSLSPPLPWEAHPQPAQPGPPSPCLGRRGSFPSSLQGCSICACPFPSSPPAQSVRGSPSEQVVAGGIPPGGRWPVWRWGPPGKTSGGDCGRVEPPSKAGAGWPCIGSTAGARRLVARVWGSAGAHTHVRSLESQQPSLRCHRPRVGSLVPERVQWGAARGLCCPLCSGLPRSDGDSVRPWASRSRLLPSTASSPPAAGLGDTGVLRPGALSDSLPVSPVRDAEWSRGHAAQSWGQTRVCRGHRWPPVPSRMVRRGKQVSEIRVYRVIFVEKAKTSLNVSSAKQRACMSL